MRKWKNEQEQSESIEEEYQHDEVEKGDKDVTSEGM